MTKDKKNALIYSAPLEAVEEMIALYRPSHLMSLLRPSAMSQEMGETPSGILPKNHLRLELDDIEAKAEAEMTAPEARHVSDLLDFVLKWEKDAPLLIHCHAGISRSTAAVFIALCALNPERRETEIASLLMARAPHAYPNRGLIRLADRALQREGRMRDAIKKIPPPKTYGERRASFPCLIPKGRGA